MIRPYYEQDGIVVYHGDCRDVLVNVGRAVDLIVADPPYGANYDNPRFGPIANDEDSSVAVEGIRLALGWLRHGRHVYAFGRYDWSALPLSGCCELIWDKGLMGQGGPEQWAPQHEYIQFASYWPSKANRKEGRGNGSARLRRGSVIKCQRPHSSGVTLHPTEKPVKLLRQLIESSSQFDERVLDPFMGSGSTLVAARLEGRSAIGIEIEERYCEIAAKRLSQGVLMFGSDGADPR